MLAWVEGIIEKAEDDGTRTLLTEIASYERRHHKMLEGRWRPTSHTSSTS